MQDYHKCLLLSHAKPAFYVTFKLGLLENPQRIVLLCKGFTQETVYTGFESRFTNGEANQSIASYKP